MATINDCGVENMLKIIESSYKISVGSIMWFLDYRYLSVPVSDFDEMHYDNLDLILLRKIYYLFDDQRIDNADKQEQIHALKQDILGIYEYFARHMTGYKSLVLCIIGDIYFATKTNESIRKSAKYYRRAMRKKNIYATKKLHKISEMYFYGVPKLGIEVDESYANYLYDIIMNDPVEYIDI